MSWSWPSNPVIMYKNYGFSNTGMSLYTSWLYLPWVIKPLWSPFIDMYRTKRFWIVGLQLVIGAALALVGPDDVPAPLFPDQPGHLLADGLQFRHA